jgi:hypothetical protein
MRTLPLVAAARAAAIPRCAFAPALGAAVRLDSSRTFSLTVFTKQTAINAADGVFQFGSCLFTKCTATTNGGAVLMNGLATLLKITKTGFYLCRSQRKGGGVYAECGDFDLSKSCFEGCTANQYAAFCEFSTGLGDSADIWVGPIGAQVQDSVISVENDRATLNGMNATKINFADGRGVISTPTSTGASILLKNLYIAACQMTAVLSIEGNCDGIFTANFVGNAASETLVRVTAATTKFTSCAFVEDDSTAIVNGNALLTNCYFSDAISRGMFPCSYRTTDCTVNAGWMTQDFDIAASAGCWVLVPRRTPTRTFGPVDIDDGISAGSVLVVIFIILAVVSTAYLGLQWWRARDEAHQPLTMYATV